MRARQHPGNRALRAGRDDNNMSSRPLPPDSKDSMAVGPWSRPPFPPPSFGQQYQERGDPMKVDPLKGETLRAIHQLYRILGGGATTTASSTIPRQDEGSMGERHHSCPISRKVLRAMSDEALRREQVRQAFSQPGRGHASRQPLGQINEPQNGGGGGGRHESTSNHPAPRLRNRHQRRERHRRHSWGRYRPRRNPSQGRVFLPNRGRWS